MRKATPEYGEKRRKEAREDVDKKIRELRTYLGLSQKNFGEAIGSTGTYIFQIEKQATNPSNQFIQKVCEGLRVNPHYFTDEKPVYSAVQKVEVDTEGAGQRLTKAREQKGLSMRELSRRTGISQPQISMLESGKTS